MGKVELKIDRELLDRAYAAGVNVEGIAERAIRVALQQADPAGAGGEMGAGKRRSHRRLQPPHS